VQLPYNVFDRRFEPLLADLRKMEVEVHSRSPFLQGLFFLNPDSLPSHFDQVKPFLHEIRNRFPVSNELSGALLSFCVENPLIDRVVIGVNTAEQLTQNLEGNKGIMFKTNWDRFEVKDESILLPYQWPVI